jgi:hypothetical protein
LAIQPDSKYGWEISMASRWVAARKPGELIDSLSVLASWPNCAAASRVLRAKLQQQVELVGEKLGVVIEVIAEKRERLDVRPPPGDDLGAPAGDEIEGGELLEDADRVVGAEHRHRAGQLDVAGVLRHGRQHDGRGRHREVAAVVLADREDVQAGLVRDLRLLDQFADPRTEGRGTAGHRVGCQLAEVIDAKFECHDGRSLASHFLCSYNYCRYRDNP